MSTATWIRGDVRDVLPHLDDGSVDLVVTSPPFWRQRAYLPPDHPDKGREIGQETSPGAFLDVLLALTAEWRRLLTPHGSIAIELGDTMSGSGGAGGDYDPDGFRAGQPRWNGSARAKYGESANPGGGGLAQNGKRRSEIRDTATDALAKSHCMIPEAYRFALVWGLNPFTGAPSPAGKWIVRNVVDWCRRNPTPGDDGDKFRRASTDIVIATLSTKRWWDDTPVRQPAAEGDGTRPLYDWWDLASEPYPGAHYAVWPPEVARRLIVTMCPMQVCTTCGQPQRRTDGDGWTDCGHGTWRTGNVLDPFGGSGTTGAVATGNGRDATLIELDDRNLDLAYDRIGGLFLTERELAADSSG